MASFLPSPASHSTPGRAWIALPDAVDHVTIGTADLDRAQDRLAALGLSHTPVAELRWPAEDGPHRARSLCVVLPDGHLDVIERPAAPAGITATGVVLRADDGARARERMLAAGIRCGRPYTVVRCFDGAGPDQRYAIFGIDARHASGLPQAIVETAPAPPIRNRSPHSADVETLAEALELLGLRLEARGARSAAPTAPGPSAPPPRG